ncbi:MAG TPA: GNAT family N-acetyltransferase [Candidatus Dormibacteraeota bacterium]
MTPGELAPAGTPYMAELLNDALGAGLYTVPGLLRDVADPAAHVLAVNGDRGLVGGAVSRLLVPEDASYYAAFGAVVEQAFKAGPIGSFEGLAVAPAARGRGLGSQLLAESVRWIRERGGRSAVALSWVSRQATSAGLFVRAGFEAGPTIEDFYYQESRRDGWTCPVCNGPCHCAAQFYWRPIDAPSRA